MVLKSPSIPSVLVETSFITNPNEGETARHHRLPAEKSPPRLPTALSAISTGSITGKPIRRDVNETRCRAGKNFSAPAPGQPLSAAGAPWMARRLLKMPGSGKAVAADAAGAARRPGVRAGGGSTFPTSMATPCAASPPPRTARSWPDAVLKPWGVSLVVHPLNPLRAHQPCQRAVLYCRKAWRRTRCGGSAAALI